MTRPVIDLNSDIGEGFGPWPMGDDDALLSIVTSANVACGYHAGDPTVMRKVCALAAERGITIGAQVGYRDLPGFGRRFIDADPRELVNDAVYQIAALDGFARLAGTSVAYVKPHGALYNAVVHHEAQARALADAVSRYDSTLAVLGLPGSAWLAVATDFGLTTVHEAFADRAYTPEGTLVSRREPGAVLHDPDVIVQRCLRMVTEGVVEAIDGSQLPLAVDSLCVHGDTPGAVRIARRLREELRDEGLTVRSFAAPAATREEPVG
ncbi:5-oxoprolinase subunit PxpA [Streptomyces sp. NPDC046805]|uniref:LamB/YcsF family protein n=1 Tax=Streptomyces sp. NPDC046805 TaxID=3155134 RepID=UPI003400B7A7